MLSACDLGSGEGMVKEEADQAGWFYLYKGSSTVLYRFWFKTSFTPLSLTKSGSIAWRTSVAFTFHQ